MRPNWTPQETAILKKLYPRTSWLELQQALPRWNKHQLCIKAGALHLRREVGKNSLASLWTPAEDAILKQHYLSASNRELRALLPDRTLQSAFSRMRRLGLKRRSDPDQDREDAISVAEHHKQMIQKYSGQPSNSAYYASTLRGFRDWAVSMAQKANRQEVRP